MAIENFKTKHQEAKFSNAVFLEIPIARGISQKTCLRPKNTDSPQIYERKIDTKTGFDQTFESIFVFLFFSLNQFK